MAFEEHFLFDVFISHSSKDKAIVRALAERLRADGVAVWFDEWLIRPGDSIALAIEKGLERSRVLLLIMSSHAFASEWTTLERHTALFRDPTNEKRRFVPLRIDDSDIVSTLRQFAYVDWRQPSESEYKRLLGACLTIPPEPRPTSGFFSLKKQFTIKKHDFVAMAMSPDGVRAAIGSTNKALSVWSIETGAVLTSLVNADFGTVVTAAKFFDNGKHLVAGSHGGAISIWDETGRLKISGSVGGSVHGLDVDESKQLLAIACGDKAVHLLSLDNLSPVRRLVGHQDRVFFVKFAPRHGKILSGGCDNTVRVWNGASGECTSVLTGHTNFVHEAGFVGDGSTAITCSNDKTLRLWNYDAAYPRELGRLEGHTSAVIEVDVAGDGNFVLSSGADKSLRLWDIQSKSCVGAFVLEADSVGRFIPGKNQAVSAGRDGRLCIWDLPISLAHQVKKSPKELYTNAKVLLVGDSGVGKSGLAIRLTQDRFETTASTDAHWVTQLKLPDARSGDLSQTAVQEREIWLWDFAGQADYRLIHQLFMDETALAVLVFNPQGEHLFEGLSQWDQSLVRSARRKFAKLLVAGRCDRGGLTVGRQPFEEFAAAHNFASFIESSALTGAGCATLRNEIVAKIDWDSIPWTASTQTFKKLKDEILGLRDENVSILRMSELKQRLEFRMPAESFTIDELRAVVGLLAGPGLIVKLEFGDLVVLQPEWINKYAAAVIRSVRSDVGEMGVIDEAQVLAGELVYTTDTRPTHAAAKQAGAELEMQRLEPADEAIILRAMHQMFVDHGICVRNTLAGGRRQLIFPSYFKRELPQETSHPPILVTYEFSGHADEIYATLIVQLWQTKAFEQDKLWRYAADFKSAAGLRLGLSMSRVNERRSKIDVYFDPHVQDDTKVTFIKYVHEHLLEKASEVVRLRNFVCTHCGHVVRDSELAREILDEEGSAAEIRCQQRRCDKLFSLWDAIERKFASAEFQQRVSALERTAKAKIDNESRELILEGHARVIAGEAGQIYRSYVGPDHGIDGEIEFKDYNGAASGKRVYLQLKSGDSYLHKRKRDGADVFRIKKARWVTYWRDQPFPVMLVIRTSDEQIRWMNVTEFLIHQGPKDSPRQIIFTGEPLTSLSVQKMRDRFIPFEGVASAVAN